MATTYLSRTLEAATNRKICTYSGWVKKSSLSGSQMLFGAGDTNARYGFLNFANHNALFTMSGTDDATDWALTSSRVFRDPAFWYHVCVTYDSTESVAADRIKMYINGTQLTSFSAETYPDLNEDFQWTYTGDTQLVGKYPWNADYWNGIMAHVHYIDGTAYAPTAFAETDSTSGIWIPITSPSITYGNQGFFLKFASGALGTDSSGNGNNFTVSGTMTTTKDTPQNNFATINPVARTPADTGSLTNGNNTYSLSNYSYNGRSTLAMTTGKWYWEYKTTTGVNTRVGICTSGYNPNLDTDDSAAYWGSTGNGGIHVLNTSSGTSWGRTNNDTSQNRDTITSALASGAGSIISIALDVDAGKMWCAVNGVWFNSGDPAAGTNDIMTLTNSSPDPYQVFLGFNSSSAYTADVNFGNGYFGTTAVSSSESDDNGEGSFEYDVPAGFYALCTNNLGSES